MMTNPPPPPPPPCPSTGPARFWTHAMPVARTALAALGLLAALGTTAAPPLSAQSANLDSLKIVSSAGTDSTYAAGDTIKIRTYWSLGVNAYADDGIILRITIGSVNRNAVGGAASGFGSAAPTGQATGGGNAWVELWYLVQTSDMDADGISTHSFLNGSVETSASGDFANLSLGSNAITNAAAHKVDGAQGYPKVTGVTISSSAGSDSTYAADDTIAVTVAFDSAVAVTGTPQLALGIGSQTRQASYASGTGSASLVFRYVVVAADSDTDGISIGASALSLNGGTIRLGTKDAVLSSLGSHAIANAAAHKVSTPPIVSGVVFPTTPADSTWYKAQHIHVAVQFSASVWVTGTPRLALGIGANTRQASYVSGSGSDSLVFRYEVVGADEDTDGLSIGASALTLNSGTIKASSDSMDATLSLGSHAVSSAAAHKVDGITRVINGIGWVADAGPDSTFAFGDELGFNVYFNGSINPPFAGQVWFNLRIGSRLVRMDYIGVGSNSLSFRYYITTADVDADGLSIEEDALVGSVSGGGRAANTTLSILGVSFMNDATRKVDGLRGVPDVQRTSITSDAGNDSTYVRGDVIEVGVVFDENVAVTGTPRLALTIGANTRQADYVSGSGGDSLTFRYAVTPADADNTGISYSASALTLNGGTIKGTVLYGGSPRDAYLNLGTQVVADDAAHKVNGATGPPVVTGVAIASDAGNDSAYAVSDVIEVGVVFVENVDVTGTPQLALTIGSQTRQASYASGTGGDSLTFRYTVVAGDVDTDGLSIGESALTLNGGTIRRAGSTTVDAVLGLTVHAVTNAAAHRVWGVQGLPHVTGTAIASDPGTDSTYAFGDTIEVAVLFNENVNVTGTPRLALEIGAATRQANYVSGTGGDSLTFRYVTVAADTDSTGISYLADALTLNGGTIRRVATTVNAVVSLLTHVVTDDATHKVLPTSNKVTGLSVNSAGEDSIFARGDTVKVTLAFRETTVVTGTPRARIWLGAGQGWANYHSGSGTSQLEFRYVVQSGIEDKTGVGILSDAVDLNGGTIRDANQINVNPWIDASLTIVDDPRWKVAGSARVTSVSVGRPPTGDVFERGDTIVVTLVYSDSVDVTGVPTAWLKLTSATHRPATYVSGTGTDTLEFRYVVEAGDHDNDGLSLYGNAIQLTGGSTIREAGTTTSALHDTPWPHAGQDAVSNSAGHKVAGAARIASLSLGSPTVGDTFERGDTIKVTLVYTDSVDVTGVPTVWVAIGSNNFAGATYASGTGTDTLEFHRVVQSADSDSDGISIVGNALQLTGGSTIREAGTTTNTFLGVPWVGSGNAVTNSAGHKVAGSQLTAPTVTGVAISSSAGADNAYGFADTIAATVSFVRPVTATGTPQLALSIGDSTRQADYSSGTGTGALEFRYVVAASDVDADGLSIGGSALALNGGTIVDVRDGSTAASLGLGSHAITNASAHKVRGDVPVVRAAFFLSAANSGLAYASTDSVFGLGDEIRVGISFSTSVTATGTPRLALGIGAQTRSAAQCGTTSGGAILVFCYTVVAADADATGISIGANALTLPGGATIRATGTTTDARLSLVPWNFADAAAFQVDGTKEVAPGVSGVTISSAPAGDSTYGRTEAIEVEVEFERSVAVTGVPQLALSIDTLTRQASYARGSGTWALVFRYVVVAVDADSTGIGIGASALALNGGTIVLSGGTTAATLGLGTHAIANDAAHKVDGNLGPPGVSALTIGSPVVGDEFERGETIEVELVFNRAVDVTGTPRLALTIGSATRQASYASGTGTTSLVFRYVVASGDADADGLSIGAGALTLSGGTIRLAGGTLDATLGLGASAVTNSGGHQVAGGTFTVPAVSAVTISSAPASGQTYQLGESIEVKVAFGRPVAVTGTPRLALTIGTVARQASYESATSKADTLVFGYAVRPSDADADGLSIGASALTLNGGTIADVRPGAAAAALGLGSSAVTNDASHKVNGGLGPPGVTGLTVASPPTGTTFERGDTVVATVRFNKSVDVTGTPRLALGIGSQTRQAAYASGTGTAALVFRYVVVTADVDADGLSVGTSALTLNGGTIDVAGGTTDALLSLEHQAFENFLVVNGGLFTASSVSGVSISSSPASDSTYGRTEAIGVEVTFDRNVAVTGAPQLALGIGSQTRQAAYASGSGTKTLTFQYTVVAADADANGLSIGTSALALNGGTIADARDASEAAGLGLGSNAISNAAAHKVDGAQGPPGVIGVVVGSPPVGDTFERGDAVAATVTFNRPVAVTGTPQLALGIGTQTRQASYASGSGTASLVFQYTVVQADVDADGLSIGTSALALNSGTIRLSGGTLDATLGLGTHAISNSGSHKVAGGTFTASSVSGVAISSSPSSGDTYGLGEEIEVEVTFVRPVNVTGAPQVALTVGAATRQAEYASGTGTKTLTFGYEVVAGDADANGIGIGTSALALNSGTINDARDGTTAASLGLGSSAVSNAAAHKVDGSLGPPGVTGLSIGSPQVGDTFERGETIEVEVVFNKSVAVTGTPQLQLRFSSGSKQADYASGTGTDTLVFRYVVVAADADADGLGIGASDLRLNGGTIRRSGATTDAVLGLGSHAVIRSTGHKVAGGTFTASAVSGVAITSAPSSDSTYGRTEVIEVEVGFTRPVTVTGRPQLALTIGSQTRQASYASGSGTATLAFRYTVVATDADSTGIGIAATALALNGGTINDARGGTTVASLGLGSNAISNAAAHKVDGSRGPPGVTSLTIGSPVVGDVFERGETIEVSLVFNRSVDVTGEPRLALTIGSATRQAAYASGTGTDSLVFRYVVAAGDADSDGISIGSSALALSGGTIKVAGGTLDATLGLGSSAVTNSGGHKVAGGTFTTPAPSAVTISSVPASGQTYQLGESIEVKVAFGRPVAVTGSPRLALTIGTQTRQAGYESATSKADTLVFGYAVRPSDADADGLSVGASALTLNGGAIADVRPGAAAASLDLGSSAVTNDVSHKVNGGLGPPGVTGLTVAPPPGGTFERGDTVVATVTFNKAVDVTGTPQLALGIGGQTRQAAYASGTGTAALVFRYVVVTADADADGLSVGASALALNSGTIDVAGGTTDALLSLAHHAIGNDGALRVAGGTFTASSVSGVTISSSPAGGGTYGLSEEIEVEVTFDRNVTVTGSPELALTIGTQTRQASYATTTGGRVLSFAYTVVAADADGNGLSIGAGALGLNGGTIVDARDTSEAASLGLGSHAISNAGSHRVDGTQGPPGVSGVSIASPVVGDTFERGDTVVATVVFNKAVDVTGTPQLALGIGSTTKQASYASGTGTASLVFRYVVVTADADADGISIAASALALNGGTIDVAGGTVDAVLGLGTHAVLNSDGHKVAGVTFTAASVSGVALISSPAVATTYGRDERIEVQVTFNRRVTVTGTPRVALTVGAQTRQADYVSGTGTRALTFRYTVVAADADTDGISIGASALALNSGAIADARDGSTAAVLGLGSHALSAAAGHKVDGTLAGASVSGVAVSSTPDSADTYGLGERIEVQVTFDRAVTVTGSPELALTVGTVARQASYAGGSGTATLSFAYRVRGAGSGGSGTGGVDADADGVGVAAAALTLNGGTIVNTADGVRPATLALSAHVIAAAANDKVDGTIEVAPVVVGVAVTSEPVATGLYGAGGVIRVEVTFSRPVDVAGASSSPALAASMSAATAANTAAARLALDVGGTTRHARYVSGSGTAVLAFEYVVRPADRDPDGISIPTDALAESAGALRIAGGTTLVALDLGAHAVTDLVDHAVNGAGSLDPVFGRLEYEFELAENVAGPLPVGEVVATSPLGAEMRYGLESGGEGLFEVDVGSGVVTYVGGGEDAEQRSEYVMLVVAVTDGVGEDEQLETVAKVTVKVVNENDEAPSFVEDGWAFELAEDAAGPLVLGVLEAVDPDEGDTLTYALVAGDAERFELDGETGELRYVGGGEDYEAGAGPWVLEATATDLLGRTARTTATVVVADVNEPPSFADSAYAFELAENAAGPLVLGAVRATDPDRDDPPVYSLAEGDAERFEVDAVTGEVRYVGAGEDAETDPESWQLEVRATDRGGVAASARVVVALLDRNEAPVFAAERYEWEFEENVAGPLVLGAVEAADPDRADTLVYSLSGEGAALFEVDAATGEVRYAGAGEDYETGPASWEFEVVATDGEGLAARAVATVALLDVNEAPAFSDSAYAFELAENAAGPLTLGAVEATDPDRGDAPAYSLALAEGDGARFEVDARTGEVRYVGSGEDYEQGPPTFALTVRATDTGGLTAEAGVSVTLLDVNEGPEAVGAMSPKTLEAYGDAVEEELGQYFRDPDGDALTYAVESSAPAVAAVTVTGAGRLSIAPQAIGEAVVTVRASDPGGLSARQQVRVTVEASRSERARALELTLAAFGRSLGTETVDAIGGRLGLGSSGALGRSHVQLGGRSLACGAPGAVSGGFGGGVPGVASAARDQTDGGVAASADGRTDGDAANAVHEQADAGEGHAEGGDDSGAAGIGGSGHCGLESLVRGATGLLGLQITHPGSAEAAGGTVDLAALFFGDGRGGAFGQPTAGGMGGMGGAYQGRQQPEAGRADRGGLTFNPVDARGLRSQSSFQLAFGGQNGAAAGEASGASASSQAAVRSGWTVWGQANLGEFEGRPRDGFAMDGRTRSAYLGLDYRFGSGFLMGLAGSRSDMEAGFDSDVNGAGSVAARLTSLYPYLHWSSGGGFGVWGLAGAGRGDATLEESAGGRFDTDLEMRMGALGVRQELTGGLALKADAFAVRILSDEVAGLAGVTADAQRVRLAPEIGGQWSLGGGLAMRTRLEVGGRFDGGDAETGMGAEAGAEVGLAHQASGFSMTARGRALLVHQERDFKDWGAGFSLRLQPGGGGESEGGLSFSVEPTWGDAGRGARALWQGGADVWRTAGAGGFGAPGGAARPVGANLPAGTGLAQSPSDPSAQGVSATHGDPAAGASPGPGLPAGAGVLPSATGAPGWAPDRLAMEVGYGVMLAGGAQVKPFGRWSREGPTGHRVNVGTRWSLLGGETTGQEPAAPGLRLMMDLFGEHIASGVQPPERRIGLSGRIVF